MESKLAIPVPELRHKEDVLEPAPLHLPLSSEGKRLGELTMPLPEPSYKSKAPGAPPTVEQYPFEGKNRSGNDIPIPEFRFCSTTHSSSSMYLPYASGAELRDSATIPIPGPRFKESSWDPPSSPPPYASLFDRVFEQCAVFKRKDALRQDALHQVKLKAGQHAPVNGELGRNALPTGQRLSMLGADLGAHPRNWCIPEAGDGILEAVSI